MLFFCFFPIDHELPAMPKPKSILKKCEGVITDSPNSEGEMNTAKYPPCSPAKRVLNAYTIDIGGSPEKVIKAEPIVSKYIGINNYH